MAMTLSSGNAALLRDKAGDLLVRPVTRPVRRCTNCPPSVMSGASSFRIPIVASDPASAFVAEGAEITASDATLAEVNVVFRKLAGLTVITNGEPLSRCNAGIRRDHRRRTEPRHRQPHRCCVVRSLDHQRAGRSRQPHDRDRRLRRGLGQHRCLHRSDLFSRGRRRDNQWLGRQPGQCDSPCQAEARHRYQRAIVAARSDDGGPAHHRRHPIVHLAGRDGRSVWAFQQIVAISSSATMSISRSTDRCISPPTGQPFARQCESDSVSRIRWPLSRSRMPTDTRPASTQRIHVPGMSVNSERWVVSWGFSPDDDRPSAEQGSRSGPARPA